jgi:hypothetical protein
MTIPTVMMRCVNNRLELLIINRLELFIIIQKVLTNKVSGSSDHYMPRGHSGWAGWDLKGY